MTDQEIVQALRCCADHSCSAKCPAFPAGLDCREEMHKEVLALLERLTAENAALRADLRENGCTYCKHARECTDDMHVFGQEDCDRCTRKPDCICMKCSGYGSSTDHWEWRGVSWMPALPNEGGLSWAPGSLGAEGEQPKNEPLTLQELVELNGQPVWMGEPFNKWARFEIDSKNLKDITPEMKIRKGIMNVNGELVEIPPVNFYRKPIKAISAGDEQGEKA